MPTATATVWTPYAAATLNGTPITGVRKARVVSSFTDPVTKIYLSVYPRIAVAEGDVIAVTTGGGSNNVLSGTGTVYSADAVNSGGGSYEYTARGPLFKAQRYTNNVTNGLTLADLLGGPATDEDIAMAVLDVAGVVYDPGDIGGTGIIRGSLGPSAYTWKQGETALSYLTRLSRASLGYRMIESIGGDVQRVQVYGRPQATPQFYLTEGVDILTGAHVNRDGTAKYEAITVTGFDFGEGDGAVSFSIPDPTPPGVEPYVYSSDMIERTLEADPGDGIAAETVATDFVEPEVNRISVRVSGIKTPRDDLFAPGQTHQIDSSLLDLDAENLWLFGVTRECNEQWFTQTLEYVGGSTASGGYTGPA
jgi:hypothetical protein